MVRKYTLVDIILMVESFESMNVFSGRTNRALSGTSQNDDGTVGRTNRQRKKSNQVATSLTSLTQYTPIVLIKTNIIMRLPKEMAKKSVKTRV